MKEGQVLNISHISSLNFRIARQVLDCSNVILKDILDREKNTIHNTMIVSPPGRGKTTILKDLIRKLSNGIKEYNFYGVNIGVVDERGEIAAMYKGVPQNDIGIRTDVLDNISKAKGMKMLIRSMNPQIIAVDEVGSEEDIEAIQYAQCSGVKGIFTAHGESLEDIIQNPILKKLYEQNFLEKIFFIKEDRKIILEYENIHRRAGWILLNF